nr:clavesin-2-like [Vanessa tameamea]
MTVRPLCPALAEIARVELNEDTEKLEESIQYLKQWIENQPHLRARTDDQWLAAFLRGTKFRLEQTKSKMDLYFSLRSTAPYLHNIKYYEPKVIEILNIGCTLILQKTKNPGDPRVIIYRLGLCDPKKFSLIDILTVFGFQEQICFMEDDNFVVSGIINVVDLTGSTLAHYTQASIKQIRNIIRANQEAVPLRIKSMHFINSSPFLETFLNISKRFMSEKSKQRIMIHNKNIESLHEYVPKEVLPEEYGGTGDSIQNCIDHWKKKMSDYSSFFEDDLKYGSDESKRSKKPQPVAIEKNFRRLELD